MQAMAFITKFGLTYAAPMQGAKPILYPLLYWKVADHAASSGAGDLESVQSGSIKEVCGIRMESS